MSQASDDKKHLPPGASTGSGSDGAQRRSPDSPSGSASPPSSPMAQTFTAIAEGLRAVSGTSAASREMNARAIERIDKLASQLATIQGQTKLSIEELRGEVRATLDGFRYAYDELVNVNKGGVEQLVEGRKGLERATKDITQTAIVIEAAAELEMSWGQRQWRKASLALADRSWPYVVKLSGWMAVNFFVWLKAIPAIFEAIKALIFGG